MYYLYFLLNKVAARLEPTHVLHISLDVLVSIKISEIDFSTHKSTSSYSVPYQTRPNPTTYTVTQIVTCVG
jgi:hypothetical protein